MTPDLNDIRKLLITLLALSLIALLSSCGTRKVQKSNVKEEVKTEQAVIEKKDIETKTETKTVINDQSNEMEITPIDTSKVLIINGKTFKNAIVTIRKKKVNTTIAEKATVKDNSVIDTRVKNSSKNATKVKNTERKSNPFTSLLWLLIPALIYAVWKYKFKLIGL